MRFLLFLLIPALSFAQNGLVTIKLKNIPSVIGFWSLNGNSIVDSNFIGTTNSKDLVFKTKNTEAMRIDTNGNMGIGTATPDYKFQAIGTFESYLSYGPFDSVVNSMRIDSSGAYLVSNSAQVNLQENIMQLFADSGVVIQGNNGGNVGIGTSPPTAKLHVNGTTRLEGTPQSTTSDSLLTIDGQGNVAWRTPYYYGLDTLTNGVDTVWTSDVTANSVILLTSNGLNGTSQTGHLDVPTISAGNYFVVNSLKGNTTIETGDQRKYYWFFIRKP